MGYVIRQIAIGDYASIIQVVDEWWDNLPMATLLPRLFFIHFQKSSFIVEDQGKHIGLLIGFRSQSYPRQAYIHFVGVDPHYRTRGIGRLLYLRFFALMRDWGCTEVHSITSPQNKGSIIFHQKLNFTIEPGDAIHDGVDVTSDYDGQGGARVLLKKQLSPEDIFSAWSGDDME